MNLYNYWKHFKTISKHKWEVGKVCFKIGLYKQGMMHDLSKYGKTEFLSSAKYFQGNRSPIEVEKDEIGYSIAWQHHKGHNPHHWEYWIDNLGTYKNTPCKIPYKYVLEMICDWIGAGKVYNKEKWTQEEPWNYYQKCKNERIFHPETQKLIEYFLKIIKEEGIDGFVKKVKNPDYIVYDYLGIYLP